MFAPTLLPLPPPASSLLPTLSQPASEPLQQSHLHPQSRRKHANRLNTPLTTLSHDERLIASRKLAIAMYGYSWLKPAGCNKTMLGRREEELEREEVERQLREVELQERMAMEQEEQERREELRRQAEGGEVEGVGERDLDDEVPEAEDEEDAEEEEDLDGDLDDEIPDADADAHESSWVYDTRREPDTESEGGGSDGDTQPDNLRAQPRRPPRGIYTGQEESTANESMVNAMLDEDELSEYDHPHDLDDDVPDMDVDLDMDMDMDANLSDEVPDADATPSPGWEHTDSELEESEMDISLLPPHPSSTSRNPGTTHEEMRRVSGNRMMPPPAIRPPPESSGRRRDSGPQQRRGQDEPRAQANPRTAPRRNVRTMMRTPATADDISALISTGGTSALVDTGASHTDTGTNIDTADQSTGGQPGSPHDQRRWPNVTGARRNLFGGFRGGVTGALGGSSGSGLSQAAGGVGRGQTRPTGPVSSGGLFTPSPRIPAGGRGSSDSDSDNDDGRGGEPTVEVPRSRTRSGRLLGGLPGGVGRRARRRGEGET